MVKTTDSRFELSHYNYSPSKKEHLWASRFGKIGEQKCKLYLQTRLQAVSTFNGCHETNTGRKSGLSQVLQGQRKCLGKAASLMFAPGNVSTADTNSASHSLSVSHLNTPLLWFVCICLKAFYHNSLSSNRISNLNQEAHGVGGKTLTNLGLVKCMWEEALICIKYTVDP